MKIRVDRDRLQAAAQSLRSASERVDKDGGLIRGQLYVQLRNVWQGEDYEALVGMYAAGGSGQAMTYQVYRSLHGQAELLEYAYTEYTNLQQALIQGAHILGPDA
jgi:hypothetical protein